MNDVISADVSWTNNHFFVFTEKLKSKGLEISFWENEENWASIIRKDTTMGYIWRKYPLVFIVGGYEHLINECRRDDKYPWVIKTDSLSHKEFMLDYHELKDRIDFGIDQNSFSAEDLWFFTNRN